MKKLLSGVIILDLSRYMAGPYGSMILGDLGAEVIKIENPRGGDPTRTLSQVELKGERSTFLGLNRSKKSLTLDLSAPKGTEVFHDLVRKADAVYENFRPAIKDQVGCDYETLKAFNPRIICCSVSGFGLDGPYREYASADVIAQGMGGVMSLTGAAAGPPMLAGIAIGDAAGGMFAAHGILAALYHRSLTGVGQQIDISLMDCQVALLTPLGQDYLLSGELPPRQGADRPTAYPHKAFQTQDGYIAVVAFADHWFEGLCRALGLPDLLEDPRFDSVQKRRENRGELDPILGQAFLRGTTEQWFQALTREKVPAGPVNTLEQVVSDPQVKARRMVVEVEHPVCGRYRTLGNPIKCSAQPDGDFLPPPTLGQHTEEVLSGLLGYSPEEIARLRREGIL